MGAQMCQIIGIIIVSDYRDLSCQVIGIYRVRLSGCAKFGTLNIYQLARRQAKWRNLRQVAMHGRRVECDL